MSSVVNKSQKRFMPKVASRGPGGRAPARRLSSLRTSFSVSTTPDQTGRRRQSNTATASSQSEVVAETSEGSLVDSSRAALLGLRPANLDEITESAVEDEPVPEPLHHHQDHQQDEQSIDQQTPTAISTQLKTAGSISAAPRTKLRPPQPRLRALNSSRSTTGIAPPTVSKSSANFVPSSGAPAAESRSTPAVAPAAAAAPAAEAVEAKPEAPPGCEVIWPEDLPELRASERRRKMALEKDFLGTMRKLYAEREKSRLMDEAEEINEHEIEIQAQEAAEKATYHQLKQAVGNEAKAIRDQKLEQLEEQSRKTVLDVNKFTMAALCRDIPVGDRNDNYDDYELARINRRRDTVRVFRAKMWSRKMYEPKAEERLALQEAFKKYQDERKERSGKIRDEQKQKFTEIDDATTDGSTGSHPQAAIEIGANGDISLVGTQFDRHKNNRSQREGSVGPRTEVDRTEQVINSYSFSTRERPDRWTPEETLKFYEAVSALGTDFNLISHLFPMRSRNQIKTKFKYEEKRNPTKLQMYLVAKRKFNLDSYSQVSNVPIEDVDSIESELEKVRHEHAEQMRLEETSRKRAKDEDQKKGSAKRSGGELPARNPKRERVE